MEEQMLNTLIQYGFSEKEAQIYLVALSIGGGAASSLGRLAKINRSTTYSILQDFVRRHIATNIQENGSSVFQVVPFVQLVRALEEEIAHKQDLVKQLTDFIPHFDALGLKKKPVLLESYFGLERVKQLYADIIGKANEIYAYIGADAIDKELEKYLYQVNIPMRVKKNVFAHILISDSENNRKYAKFDEKGYKETKILPIIGKEIHGEICLYNGEYIALISYSSDTMFGTIIKSKQLYSTLKVFFDYFWELA